MHFMKLPEEYCKEDSYFKILPIAYEGDVTYGKGASKGPDEIIKASEHMEYYEEQFDNFVLQPFHGNFVQSAAWANQFARQEFEPFVQLLDKHFRIEKVREQRLQIESWQLHYVDFIHFVWSRDEFVQVRNLHF